MLDGLAFGTQVANNAFMSLIPRLSLVRLLLPAGAGPESAPLLVARALRAVGDGYMAVLLPAYLLAIGMGTLQVGIVSTATMLGSALATLAVGAWGHRFAANRLLRGAAALMAATGLGFASLSSFVAGITIFWPILSRRASILLASAMRRHLVGSPYSVRAIFSSVSPF